MAVSWCPCASGVHLEDSGPGPTSAAAHRAPFVGGASLLARTGPTQGPAEVSGDTGTGWSTGMLVVETGPTADPSQRPLLVVRLVP